MEDRQGTGFEDPRWMTVSRLAWVGLLLVALLLALR